MNVLDLGRARSRIIAVKAFQPCARSLFRIALIRHANRDHFVAVPTIDPEVSIEGKHLSCAVDLRKSNETCVRQRHRPVAIPTHKRPEIRLLFSNGKRDPNDSSFQKRKESIGVTTLPLQEKRRFSKDRLTCEQGRAQLFPLLDSPGVVRQSFRQKAHERPGVEQ